MALYYEQEGMPETVLERDVEDVPEPVVETDVGVGFAILFGTLAVLSSVAMLFGSGIVGAYGFAGVLFFGSLLIVSVHVYD